MLSGALHRRLFTLLALPLFVAHGTATAQSVPATVVVHGIAFDSLHRTPLDGALVAVTGTVQSVITDSLGRFELRLALGRYTLTMQHSSIDNLGLRGITSTVLLRAANDAIVIAIPAFDALWRSACGTSTAPTDSGFIFGSVRSSNGRTPVAGATVAVSWDAFSLSTGSQGSLRQQRWSGRVDTDSSGSYALCGVPVDQALRMRAGTELSSTEPISLITTTSRVQRRDFVLPAAPGTTAATGVVVGVLTSSTGDPLSNATVQASGVPAVRTDSLGRFVVRNVPVGTQQLDVRAIGQTPVAVVVDVVPRDTATVSVVINKVQQLAAVKTVASAVRERYVADFEARRQGGLGRYLDSTVLAPIGTLSAVYAQFPGVTVRNKILYLPGNAVRGPCLANVMLDGKPADQEQLAFLRPADIAAVELYSRFLMVPAELQVPLQPTQCGLIAVWTKRAWP